MIQRAKRVADLDSAPSTRPSQQGTSLPSPTSPTQCAAVLEAFRIALNAGDIEACVALLDEAAVLDIGSGRFEGRRQITSLLRALLRVHYVATAEWAPKSDGIVTALWAVAHDDLRRLGLERLEMLRR